MRQRIRVLLVEDNPLDAELVVMALQRAGFEPEWQRADNEADYVQQLDPALDVVLSDYSLPQFDAMRALALRQARGLSVPFILVTGSVADDVIAEALKCGAADYVSKDKLSGLGDILRRVLKR